MYLEVLRGGIGRLTVRIKLYCCCVHCEHWLRLSHAVVVKTTACMFMKPARSQMTLLKGHSGVRQDPYWLHT
uniref:Uncharacterized protein n=2 Tax=Anguilla anguilla TaxID=7936 RepID=A0A0E9SSX4_ANGAN